MRPEPKRSGPKAGFQVLKALQSKSTSSLVRQPERLDRIATDSSQAEAQHHGHTIATGGATETVALLKRSMNFHSECHRGGVLRGQALREELEEPLGLNWPEHWQEQLLLADPAR